MAFLLVTYVDETVVDAHFQFGRGFVSSSLVLVEFFQALQRFVEYSESEIFACNSRLTVH